jgi:nucleoside-diphosphate-sugar epimerase
LKAALELKIKKVIYTSTLSVYGPSYNNVPISESQPRLSSYKNDYELTKKMSEEKIRQYVSKGLPCITLNVSKVYGPGLNTFSNGINSLINLFMKKDVLFVPNHLEVASNYVYIEDVVRAHILAMECHMVSGRFIIGGENISYEALFNKIKTQLKSKTKIVKVNFSLVKSALSIINAFRNIIGKPAILTRSVLDSIFTYRVSTSQKAIKELKYQPTAFELGIKRTINNLKYSQ